jgi:hypothetical protein
VFITGSNAFLAANPGANITAYNSFLAAALGAPTANALIAAGVNNILYGVGRNYYNNQYVSRTGYGEQDVINPTTLNVKLSGALHYKLTDNI